MSVSEIVSAQYSNHFEPKGIMVLIRVNIKLSSFDQIAHSLEKIF